VQRWLLLLLRQNHSELAKAVQIEISDSDAVAGKIAILPEAVCTTAFEELTRHLNDVGQSDGARYLENFVALLV